MSNVYYTKIDSHTPVQTIKKITQNLLKKIIEKEKLQLSKTIPLKVHFGEKGNNTFIKSENYEGIIDYLKEKKIKTCFIETNVLYGGQRYRKDIHLKTAKEHGFSQLPIIIADGDFGENFEDIKINKKHFKSCKIGKDFLNYDQLIVISHFKGHALAGFGGAIKQLSMGYASKGGKMAMHMGIKPHIINKKCKKCDLCTTICNTAAIHIGKKSYIDKTKCIGCGACVAICPHKAISIFSLKAIWNLLFGMTGSFQEKLVEYAYAAQKNKRNIYFNFAMNITAGCDCEPKKMKILMKDLGIFVSTDPVSIDKACYDLVKAQGKKFRGTKQFKYAEQIGLGSTKYNLI